MKAHVEILSAIVRVGEDTDAYGKDFEYAVAVSSADGKTAVMKALVSGGDLTATHVRTAINALKAAIPGFINVTWERIRSK